MDAVEKYFADLRDIRATGAALDETSFYTPLANLFNEIGKTLKPKVRCVMTLKNQGAGMPDGGLFSADQFGKSSDAGPLPGISPARGAIEVKSARDDAWVIADGEQVTRYWKKYRLVLVSNYRDFVLVGEDADGNAAKLETFRLAGNEADFWARTQHPRKFAGEQGERFWEFLRRVLLHSASLADPKDVAAFLASYAREAKARIEGSNLPALDGLRADLENALGMKFEDARGEHFFLSTLVQTLFYGIFSAWVLWSRKHPPSGGARFDWHAAVWTMKVPMIRTLFEQIATPTKLEPLGLVEVLNWTAHALHRVNRAAFFKKFEDRHAVQYFYEPFLAAFDPVLREKLGVWYTPEEVVQYQVARVDEVLREDLQIVDGLANPNVIVLDPCCGTGAYLVEVLHCIARTLNEGGDDALTAHKLKKAAMERVFGFEILPAPFVVAHLQLNLLLQNLGAPLSEAKNERPGVFLTNALTGWELPHETGRQLRLPYEMKIEKEAAERVKRDAPILVILGNPPYSGFAGVAVAEERDLSQAYRTTKQAPAPQGQGLNDLYVRFYRAAERRIVEMSGKGVVSFISNYSWLDRPSYTGMRERFLDVFDQITIDCLNGDKFKTGKVTPDGDPDPSIFSTEMNRAGIEVGTAIATLVRKQKSRGTKTVRFRNLWGKDKKERLQREATKKAKRVYENLKPPLDLGLPFVHATVDARYLKWPRLAELFPVFFPGVKTSRDDFVVDVDRVRLVERLNDYYDTKKSHEEIAQRYPGVMTNRVRFDARTVRTELLKRGRLPDNVVRYCYRPFDIRWIYWDPLTKLLDEKRPEYFQHVFPGNLWIEARQQQPKEFDRGYFTRVLADNFGNGLSSFFPAYLKGGDSGTPMFETRSASRIPNLSDPARKYLAHFCLEAESLFFHVVSTLHAQSYREANRDALRQDWPRIPLPAKKEALLASATLGRRIAELLDPESPVSDKVTRRLLQSLKSIAPLARDEGGGAAINPDEGHLDLTAGWGHAGQDGVTMPGRGRHVERARTAPETAALEKAAETAGLAQHEVLIRLGAGTTDVYLNDHTCWRNIPEAVWNYSLGGYRVIKKWLSYREKKLLGRALAADEAEYVSEMARRIAAILLLGPALDENYQRVKAAGCDWPDTV